MTWSINSSVGHPFHQGEFHLLQIFLIHSVTNLKFKSIYVPRSCSFICMYPIYFNHRLVLFDLWSLVMIRYYFFLKQLFSTAIWEVSFMLLQFLFCNLYMALIMRSINFKNDKIMNKILGANMSFDIPFIPTPVLCRISTHQIANQTLWEIWKRRRWGFQIIIQYDKFEKEEKMKQKKGGIWIFIKVYSIFWVFNLKKVFR